MSRPMLLTNNLTTIEFFSVQLEALMVKEKLKFVSKNQLVKELEFLVMDSV